MASEGAVAAVALLAQAFSSDPLYVWLFPRADRRERTLARFFKGLTCGRRLRALFSDGRCLVATLDEPPGWKVGWWATARSTPGLLWTLLSGTWPAWKGWGRLIVAARLLTALGRARPKTPHLHLALVAVAPEARGTGLGRRVIESLSREASGHVHLETSRAENLGFYAKLGFVVTGEVRKGRAPPVWILEARLL